MTVEIVPDDEWTAATGETAHGALLKTASRRGVVQALYKWGPIEDREGGQATAKLAERMGRLGVPARARTLTGTLRNPSIALAVDREINGKRTLAITLARIPQAWSSWLEGITPANGAKHEAESVSEREDVGTHYVGDGCQPPHAPLAAVDAPDTALDTDALRLEIAGSVATALLTKVVEIISTPDASKTAVMERDDARRRLADALEHGEKLRRDLAAVGDELAAVKKERDGLRTRLRVAEANLSRITAPHASQAAVVNDLVTAEMAKIMREAPRPHGPDA